MEGMTAVCRVIGKSSVSDFDVPPLSPTGGVFYRFRLLLMAPSPFHPALSYLAKCSAQLLSKVLENDSLAVLRTST